MPKNNKMFYSLISNQISKLERLLRIILNYNHIQLLYEVSIG